MSCAFQGRVIGAVMPPKPGLAPAVATADGTMRGSVRWRVQPFQSAVVDRHRLGA